MPEEASRSDDRWRGPFEAVELAPVIALAAITVVYLLWVGAAWRFGFVGLAAFAAISAPILVALRFLRRSAR